MHCAVISYPQEVGVVTSLLQHTVLYNRFQMYFKIYDKVVLSEGAAEYLIRYKSIRNKYLFALPTYCVVWCKFVAQTEGYT